jgi:CDP-diacylglycerol--inositol 3-phosphatidyltransferase
VFFYVPQIVGYFRIVCTILSLYLATKFKAGGDYYVQSIILYMLSFIGDLFDGMAARKFDQSSKFGGVLDMVTDRCTTAGMLVVLTWLYPEHAFLFLGLLLLDISSHWVQMTSALLLEKHHKSEEGNKDKFFLVRWFYSHYPFFGYLCVGAELTYVLLYVTKYMPPSETRSVFIFFLNYICKPACVMKNIVNVAQLMSASKDIARKDAAEWNKNNKV